MRKHGNMASAARALLALIGSGAFDPKPTPYVAPPPLVDPDAELRNEIRETLRSQGVPENIIALRTAGDRLLDEARKLGLL